MRVTYIDDPFHEAARIGISRLQFKLTILIIDDEPGGREDHTPVEQLTFVTQFELGRCLLIETKKRGGVCEVVEAEIRWLETLRDRAIQ